MRRRIHTSESYFQEAVIKSLLELKISDPKRFWDLISLPANEILFSSEKFQWLGNEKSLRTFFDWSTGKQKLSCLWESFQNIFTGDAPINEKVTWQSDINELLYVIDRFQDEGIIRKHKTPHKQLEKCFLNKYGELLNSRSLASALNKGVRNESREQELERIIQAVLKANYRG